MSSITRRRHPRIAMHLAVAYRVAGSPDRHVGRATTINVSAGGLYFQTLANGCDLDQELELELAAPPTTPTGQWSAGVTGRVVRVEHLEPQPHGSGLARCRRQGIAICFSEPLRLSIV